jgi:sarcosine oxidase subunit gamma
MSALTLEVQAHRHRLGIKGPRAAEWLAANGIPIPATPNTWAPSDQLSSDALLVARLGTFEFFLEDGAAGTTLRRLSPFLDQHPPGVYPVMREDWGFVLGGPGVHEVLAQVCNVNFAALALDSHPVIMTLMIGVAVLVVPQSAAEPRSPADESRDPAGRRYRIWCDPTFGSYIWESLGAVVNECGGNTREISDESAAG